MKKLLLTLLFTLLCTGCAKQEPVIDDFDKIQENGKIIIGVREDARPFGFRQGNETTGYELVGYEIDLAKLIAENLGVKPVFHPLTGQERIGKLNGQVVDMLIATMSVTPHRQQLMEFSIPYYVAGQALMVLQGTKGTTLQEFNGRKVIIVFGSTSEKNLRLNLPDAEIIGYKTYPEAYEALKQGVGEALMADDTLLLGLAMDDPSVKILQKRYSREPYAAAFRKGPENNQLMSRIDQIIKQLHNSGELSQLQSKWGVEK